MGILGKESLAITYVLILLKEEHFILANAYILDGQRDRKQADIFLYFY